MAAKGEWIQHRDIPAIVADIRQRLDAIEKASTPVAKCERDELERLRFEDALAKQTIPAMQKDLATLQAKLKNAGCVISVNATKFEHELAKAARKIAKLKKALKKERANGGRTKEERAGGGRGDRDGARARRGDRRREVGARSKARAGSRARAGKKAR